MLPVGATLARETLRPPRSLCDSTRCATKRNTEVQAAVTSVTSDHYRGVPTRRPFVRHVAEVPT
eukprot:4181406-Heterocapsa_arctica.AAC.1